MNKLKKTFQAINVVVVITFWSMIFMFGCTDLQRQQTGTILAGVSTSTNPTAPPSTQPYIVAGQTVVHTIEEFIPASVGLFTLISGITGLAAGLVTGTAAGSKVASAQATSQTMTLKGAISELATELITPQAGVGWSKVTNDILVGVVGAAHPVVNNPSPVVPANT